MADGSSQIPIEAYPIIPTGDDVTVAENLNEGSVQYFGFVSPASYSTQPSSLIGSITIEEIAKDPFLRDIISIDDISFVVASEGYDASDYNFDLYGALELTGSSSGNVKGYVNGYEYTGDYHFMNDGTMMTGAHHGAGSDEIIYAMEESISQEIQDMIQVNMGSPGYDPGYGDPGYMTRNGE